MEKFKQLFQGRLSRLPYFLGSLTVTVVGMLVFLLYPSQLLALSVSLLTLPITVRRLHDINYSGYFAPIGWLGFFGGTGVWMAVAFNLYLLLQKGTGGSNKYGEVPKERNFIDAILNR